MASRDLIRSVAKTAAATAFGGPLAGAGVGINQAIDLIAGNLGRREKDAYTSAIEQLERDLGSFGRGEGLSAATVDRALEEAQSLIAEHGLTGAEMGRLDFDPEHVSSVVLRRGAAQRRHVDEAERELSRQVVHRIYAVLLAADTGVPGRDLVFQQEVLTRLRRVQDTVADVAAGARPAPREPTAALTELFRGVLERHELFAGREREDDALEQELDEVRAGAGRYLCVSAPAGFGKSALLAHWVSRLKVEDPAYAFVNRRAGTADEVSVLRALCQQMLAHEELAVPLPDQPADLQARLRGLLRDRPGRPPSIVMVDGLDEADWLSPGLFPPAPPPGRLIVLSRRASGDEWIGDLGLERAAVTRLSLGGLSVQDITSLLEAAGAPAAGFAKDDDFVAALYEAAVYDAPGHRLHGDPLYVRLLVEDVREKRIRSLDDLELEDGPAGLNAYFDVWWKEITAALAGAVLLDLLGYLLVAKGPITRTELASIKDDDALDEFGRENVAPLETVLASARRLLAGDDDSGLALGHPRFETYLRERRFNAAQILEYDEGLCAYCAAWREAHLLGPYALSHYVDHLVDRGADQERCDVLTDPRYIGAKLRGLGIDALLRDYAVSTPPMAPGAATVMTVGRVLRRSRITLAREPDQLAAQLYGRLAGSADPSIRRLLAGLEAVAPRFWLAARTRALASERDLDTMLPLVGTVRALAFGTLEDATILAIGVDDRITLHDPSRGTTELASFSNDGFRVTGVCLATVEGRPAVIAVAGYDGRLFVRDARSGEEVGPAVALPGYADSVVVGTVGDALAIAAAGNGQAWAWDARSGEEMTIATRDLRGRLLGVTTIDGRVTLTMAALSDGGTPELVLVDATSLSEATPVFRGIAQEPAAVAVAEGVDGVLLAIVFRPALCGLWSAQTGDAVGPYVDMGDAAVRCHALGEIDARPVVAASPDYEGTGVVLLREAGRPETLARRQRPISGVGDLPIYGLRADAAGAVWVLAGLAVSLKRVECEGDVPLSRFDGSLDAEAVASVLTGDPSPQGFATSAGGAVRLVDEGDLGARGTAAAETLRRDAPLQWPATARAWGTVDGRAVLAVGSYGGAVWLWDIAGRSLAAGPFADVPEELFVARPELKAARPPHVASLAIGRGGDRDVIATACGGKVQVWDARTSERLAAPQTGDEVIVALALGAFGGRGVLVTGSRGGLIRVWELADARPIAAITLDAGVDGVWVVRDADAVAALTGDAYLHVMDVRSAVS